MAPAAVENPINFAKEEDIQEPYNLAPNEESLQSSSSLSQVQLKVD